MTIIWACSSMVPSCSVCSKAYIYDVARWALSTRVMIELTEHGGTILEHDEMVMRYDIIWNREDLIKVTSDYYYNLIKVITALQYNVMLITIVSVINIRNWISSLSWRWLRALRWDSHLRDLIHWLIVIEAQALVQVRLKLLLKKVCFSSDSFAFLSLHNHRDEALWVCFNHVTEVPLSCLLLDLRDTRLLWRLTWLFFNLLEVKLVDLAMLSWWFGISSNVLCTWLLLICFDSWTICGRKVQLFSKWELSCQDLVSKRGAISISESKLLSYVDLERLIPLLMVVWIDELQMSVPIISYS